MFDHACCLILKNDKVLLVGNRKGNVYKIKEVALLLPLMIVFFGIEDLVI